LVLTGRLSVWASPTNRNYTEAIMMVRDAQSTYPGRWFWIRARSWSAKCSGAPCCSNSGQHETVKIPLAIYCLVFTLLLSCILY